MVGFLKRVERIFFFFQNFLRFFPYFLSSIFLSNFICLPKNLFFNLILQKKKGECDGVLVHHHIASHFCHFNRLFHLFPGFWSYFCVTIWRSFWPPFSSNFISLEKSRFLVSIDSNLARFGATIIKILCPKGRWRSVRNSVTFFFKKFVPSNPW